MSIEPIQSTASEHNAKNLCFYVVKNENLFNP